MRVRPTVWIGLAVFVGYTVIVAVMWAINDVDYNTVQDSVGNVLKGIVVPIGVGVAYLAAVTTWFGWWGPAVREPIRNAPRWMLTVPMLFALGALLNVVAGATADGFTVGLFLTIGAGVLLVGFSEELVSRGLLLTGARGTVREVGVWFVTCLMFGLLHAINAFFGQSGAQTALQIGMAFLFGSVFYVTRRVTGTLVVPMLMHAAWDWGSLSVLASGATGEGLALIGGPLGQLSMLVAVIALFTVFRYNLDGERASSIHGADSPAARD